jgi:transcriptional regulator with XRE-family HTH domain/tetratricopeptide (TPR) repeat protein
VIGKQPGSKRQAARPPAKGDAELGRRIRKYRERRGLSREALAPQVGRSKGWLLKVENGRSDPLYADLVLLAERLGVEMALFFKDENSGASVPQPRVSDVAATAMLDGDGGAQPPRDVLAEVVARLQEEILGLTRRQAIAGGVAWGGALGLRPTDPEPWERLAFALRHPGRVDQQTVGHLEDTTVALSRLEPVSSSDGLLGPVTGQLDTLGQLLRGSLPSSIRQQLCSVAAETAGLAGWLRWLVDDTASADRYFRVALEAAHEAEDRALGAYLMGRAACQPFYREEPAVRLQRLVDGVHGFRQADATPRTQAWLNTLAAEAHALQGDEDGCRRSLELAEVALSAVGGAEEAPRPRLSFFDGMWLEGTRGAILARLGRMEEAQPALRTALEGLDPLWLKHQTWLLVILAGTYAAQGQPIEACRQGTAALRNAVSVRANADLQLVASLRRNLAPWSRHPAVQQFDADLRAALHLSRN